jgi:hypothetical protein
MGAILIDFRKLERFETESIGCFKDDAKILFLDFAEREAVRAFKASFLAVHDSIKIVTRTLNTLHPAFIRQQAVSPIATSITAPAIARQRSLGQCWKTEGRIFRKAPGRSHGRPKYETPKQNTATEMDFFIF